MDEKSQGIHYGQGDPRTLPQDPIPGGEFGYCLAEFLAAVREKRQPETGVADHVRSLALSLAVIDVLYVTVGNSAVYRLSLEGIPDYRIRITEE